MSYSSFPGRGEGIADMSDRPVLFSISDSVAHIEFNRPDRLNTIDASVANAFLTAVSTATLDRGIRVIILSGRGRVFTAGGDLRALHQGTDNPAVAARRLIEPMHTALSLLADSPKIVLASVHGAVTGAGMSLMLAADLCIAADNTTFNLAYARIANSPDCGGSWYLPRVVGWRKAMEIALLAEDMDAHEALRLALVNRVVPSATLQHETRCMGERLAESAPLALASIKHLMRTSHRRSLNDQLCEEAVHFTQNAASHDFGEALSAFFGKRTARFQGR